MAQIRPFRGLRPPPGAAAQIASPPYDVVSTEEARAILPVTPAVGAAMSEILYDRVINFSPRPPQPPQP